MATVPKGVDVNSVPWKSNEEFFRETGTTLDDYAPIDWEAHVDRLIAIAKWIPPHKLTILTGTNASGKSVIRKLMQRAIADRLGLEPGKPCVASLSFMTRAGTHLRPRYFSSSGIRNAMSEPSPSLIMLQYS